MHTVASPGATLTGSQPVLPNLLPYPPVALQRLDWANRLPNDHLPILAWWAANHAAPGAAGRQDPARLFNIRTGLVNTPSEHEAFRSQYNVLTGRLTVAVRGATLEAATSDNPVGRYRALSLVIRAGLVVCWRLDGPTPEQVAALDFAFCELERLNAFLTDNPRLLKTAGSLVTDWTSSVEDLLVCLEAVES